VDDPECFKASTTSISQSYIAPSVSHYSVPYGTYPAVLTDTLSDFHEAKVAHPRHGLQKPERQPSLSPTEDNIGSVQDKYTEGQDLDSGSNGLSDSLEETDSVGLSKVEAGVLSACGILVVAGVAVGIFVWKNTVRRRDLRDLRDQGDMADLESHLDTDDPHGKDGNSTIVNGSLSLEDINQQQKNRRHTDQQVKDMPELVQKEEHPMIEMQDLSKYSVIKDMVIPEIEQTNGGLFAIDDQQQAHASITIEPEHMSSRSNISDHKELITASFLDILQLSNQLEDLERKLHPVDTANLQRNSATDDLSSIYKTPDSIEQDKDSIPAAQLDNSTYDPAFNSTPGIEDNVTARPSALDPLFDPTALTYPLKKLLHTPRTIASPAQISVDLGEEDDGDDENIDIQSQKEIQDMPGSEKVESKMSTLKLGQQLNKLFRYPDPVQDNDKTLMVDISVLSSSGSPKNKVKSKKSRMLDRLPLKLRRISSAQSIKEDYTEKYETEHGKPFLSPLDLPDDKYIPLRDAVGPSLLSRAQVLADPVKRLGQDEIALWEQNRKRKELKNLSYEMWDEQVMKEEVAEYDKKYTRSHEEPSSKESGVCT
jgi:hypothetical protein